MFYETGEPPMPGPSRQERALGGRKYLNVKFEPKPSIECDSKKVGLSAEFDSYRRDD